MTRRYPHALIVSLLLIGIAVAGCQHTPMQRVNDARATYTAVLHEVNTLHNAGYVTVEQKEKLAPTTRAIHESLDLAEASAQAGDVKGADQALAVANSLLDQMLTQAGIDPNTLKKR